MFVSAKRPIVIPQSEHARLSATVAMLWGNQTFARPNLPFDSFVNGVLTHDRGFGFLDSYSLGSMSKNEREKTLMDGIEESTDDAIADTISLLHIKRLLDMKPREDVKVLLELWEKKFREISNKTDISQENFIFADHITELADSIAFDFSFEEDSEGEVSVSQIPGSESFVVLKYNIKGSEIKITPWPLSADSYEGFIVGYKQEGYPKKLIAITVPFTLQK